MRREEQNAYFKFLDFKRHALKALEEKEFNVAMQCAYHAAEIGWSQQTSDHKNIGWFDEDLDDVLASIGAFFRFKSPTTGGKPRQKRKAVFIASALYDVGGHSEVMRQWIRLLRDDDWKIGVFVTALDDRPLSYPRLSSELDKMGVETLCLTRELSMLQKAETLYRYLEEQTPELLFLFPHPFEVAAPVAISALEEKPTVIYFNHADHSFWLGRDCIDYLVEYRDLACEVSRVNRKIDGSRVVHMTAELVPRDRREAREELGIPGAATVSISVGSFFKVMPGSEIDLLPEGDDEGKIFDYFEVVRRILDDNPDHYHILITGEIPREYFKLNMPDYAHYEDRFLMPGHDSSKYYGAADFVIETIPIVGGLVRLEAMLCRLPLVGFACRNVDPDYFPPEYPLMAADEEEFAQISSRLIKDAGLRHRIGEELHAFYLDNMSRGFLRERLRELVSDGGANRSVVHSERPLRIGSTVDERYVPLQVLFSSEPEAAEYLALDLATGEECVLKARHGAVPEVLPYSHATDPRGYMLLVHGRVVGIPRKLWLNGIAGMRPSAIKLVGDVAALRDDVSGIHAGLDVSGSPSESSGEVLGRLVESGALHKAGVTVFMAADAVSPQGAAGRLAEAARQAGSIVMAISNNGPEGYSIKRTYGGLGASLEDYSRAVFLRNHGRSKRAPYVSNIFTAVPNVVIINAYRSDPDGFRTQPFKLIEQSAVSLGTAILISMDTYVHHQDVGEGEMSGTSSPQSAALITADLLVEVSKLLEVGDLEAAVNKIMQLPGAAPQPENVISMRKVLEDFSETECSIDTLIWLARLIEDTTPEDPDVLSDLACLLYADGAYNACEAKLKKALLSDAQHVPSLLNLALLYANADLDVDALTLCRTLLSVTDEADPAFKEANDLMATLGTRVET